MSFKATALRRHGLVGLFVGFLTASAVGQDAVAPQPITFARDGVTTSFVASPALAGAGSNPAQWLKVEFHCAVEPAPPGAPIGSGYLPELKFRVWVEARDTLDPQASPDQGIAVALTGSVTYVNVLRGKDVFGVVYVHPSTLGRYSARGGITDFDRKFNVHVEADIDSKPVAVADKLKDPDPDWYTRVRAIPGLIFRQNQCPFITSDPDRYPAIKLLADAPTE